MKEKTLSVSAIKEGTVIDHVDAGQGLKIVKQLRLAENQTRVTLGINLKTLSGLKDLIKLEGVFLSEEQAARIAVFSPKATVNVIENYKVVKKFQVQMPRSVAEVLSCPNPRCITQSERIATLFAVEENNGEASLRCNYCEASFHL
jgi:aspartate carbamoyltransferase regulatory subunit